MPRRIPYGKLAALAVGLGISSWLADWVGTPHDVAVGSVARSSDGSGRTVIATDGGELRLPGELPIGRTVRVVYRRGRFSKLAYVRSVEELSDEALLGDLEKTISEVKRNFEETENELARVREHAKRAGFAPCERASECDPDQACERNRCCVPKDGRCSDNCCDGLVCAEESFTCVARPASPPVPSASASSAPR